VSENTPELLLSTPSVKNRYQMLTDFIFLHYALSKKIAKKSSH